MIKVKLNNGKFVEGELYSVDPVSNVVILKDPSSGSYNMIFSAQISSLEGKIPASLFNENPNLNFL